MHTIGIVEAKTKWSQLCEEVSETKEPIIITRRGIPLVRIEPANSARHPASGIWERRKAFMTRHGELSSEFELPERLPLPSDENPIGEDA